MFELQQPTIMIKSAELKPMEDYSTVLSSRGLSDFDFLEYSIDPSVLLSNSHFTMTDLSYYMYSFVGSCLRTTLSDRVTVKDLIKDLEDSLVESFEEHFTVSLEENHRTVEQLVDREHSSYKGFSDESEGPLNGQKSFSVLELSVSLKYTPHSSAIH